MKSETIYLDVKNRIKPDKDVITVNDIGKITCGSDFLKSKIAALPLIDRTKMSGTGCVISVIKVIDVIRTAFPLTDVVSMGDTLIYVDFGNRKQRPKWIDFLLTAFISLISFFGTAFTIMAFHNDINILDIFSDVYEHVTGMPSDGFTLLEISYSIGLSIGIIVFFNHFGGLRVSRDPTPVEVEMCVYEDQINSAQIATCEKEGNIIDVE